MNSKMKNNPEITEMLNAFTLSTVHITKEDGTLLLDKNCPYVKAIHPQGWCTLVRIPEELQGRIHAPTSQTFNGLKTAGFSNDFISVIKWAVKNHAGTIKEICFDKDGPIIKSLPKFNW